MSPTSLARTTTATSPSLSGEGTLLADDGLIRAVVDLFLGSSNAMKSIAQRPQKLALAGAQTLAMHLFQQKGGNSSNRAEDAERRQMADSYDYGVALNAASLKKLVHKYGGVRGRFNAPAAEPNFLPGVPSATWTRVTLPAGYNPAVLDLPPLPPAGSPARFTLPHTQLLHRVTYVEVPPYNPYVLGPPLVTAQPIQDLHLDLHFFA